MQTRFKIALIATSLVLSNASASLAMDDSATPKPVKCENGQVYDEKTKACVTSESNLIDDDTRFEAARSFAYAGQYQHAITALEAIGNQNQARVLNMLGYSNRKIGNKDLAMDYYTTALALDPNYLLARAYMGQALANEGNFEAARDQLLEIGARGGRETWAYVSLKQHLGNIGSY